MNKYLTSVDFINDRFDTSTKYYLLQCALKSNGIMNIDVNLDVEAVINDIRIRMETGIIMDAKQYTIKELKDDLYNILEHDTLVNIK